jgi:ABC-type polar amino acid transport system ATPase subunit
MRALMMKPKFMLLDEITSALDPVLTVEVMQAIRQLRERGLTMIIVTHHIEFASSLCDRIMFLSQGRAVQIDTPENLRRSPATDEVKRFLDILRAAR